MESPCNIIGSLSHLDVRGDNRREAPFKWGDIASCTSQAMDTAVVSPVMCTELPNFHITGGVGPPAPYSKYDEAYDDTTKGRTSEKLRIVSFT